MNKKDINKIKENTKIAEDILFRTAEVISPGVSTYELNQIARREFEKNKALPSAKFLGLPYWISVAINDEVLFGKISRNKKIKDGDVVKVALGIFKEGYFSDLAFTINVGTIPKESKNLIMGTSEALKSVLNKLSVGIIVKEISTIIEGTLKKHNLNPICEIMGHGIGRSLHEPPAIPNCKDISFVNYDYRLKIGDIICIEPIATTGNGEVIRRDKTSFITKDKKPSAHFELPVLIDKEKIQILGKRIFKYLESLE